MLGCLDSYRSIAGAVQIAPGAKEFPSREIRVSEGLETNHVGDSYKNHHVSLLAENMEDTTII